MRLTVGGLFLLLVVADLRAGWLRRLFGTRPRRFSDDGPSDSMVRRPEHEFHVVANRIRIVFEVPVPEDGVDEVLRDLLLHHALELIRDRKRRGQPLEEIPSADVSAKRAGTVVPVGSLDLDQPDELLDIPMPMLVPIGAPHHEDPLRKLGDLDARKAIPMAEASRLDELAPIGTDLRLTAGLAAGLRTYGIDPELMTASELGVGLLELAGFTVTKHSDDVYIASGAGLSTYVRFVNHEPASYPELESHEITEFLVNFAAAHTDRGVLITDKYGPYEIYSKERANPHCHFITRERMQAFVDSIALS
jgi:hypothetical protein